MIFGLLNIINFTHGAPVHDGRLRRLDAAELSRARTTGGRSWSRRSSSASTGDRRRAAVLLKRIAHLDHLYGLLLTFGLALIIQGLFRNQLRLLGPALRRSRRSSPGGHNLGFMFLPNYRGWVVIASLVVCLATWFVIEKTRLGAYLRAATENPTLIAGPSASTCRCWSP